MTVESQTFGDDYMCEVALPNKEMYPNDRAWNESQNTAISHGACRHYGDFKCVHPCSLRQNGR